jgi:ABC-2 type transport system permease protein
MEKISQAVNTIYILWLRQIKRYLRSRSRMLGSLAQPLLFLVALGFGFGPIYQKAGGGNYIQFLAPGVIAMNIIFTSMFSGIEIISDKQFGFLKETLAAPVSRLAIMLGRTLGGATVAAGQSIVVFAISLMIGFHPILFPYGALALLFMILTAIIFTALGTIIGSLLDDMSAFPLIMNFLIMPLFFLSGALFPLDKVPEAIKAISAINPLSYGVDGLRGTLAGQFHFSLPLDFFVLLLFALLLLGIGSYFFSKIRV